jgi:signal transduction histidine kinase
MPEPATDARPEPAQPYAAATPQNRKRHARSPALEGAPDSATASSLVRLAIRPAAAIAVLSSAVVVFLLFQNGTGDAVTGGVLVGAAVLACAILALAARDGRAEARVASRRYSLLQATVAEARLHMQGVVSRLERGERVEQPAIATHAPPHGDALAQIEHEIRLTQSEAGAALLQVAELLKPLPQGRDETVAVFVNLSRRLQSLVHRELKELDDLEHEVEDPDLIKRIFFIDHLATRIRRHAENVAVLGGAVSRRQWSRPVTLTEVLRSSISEVEQYSRVKLVPPIEGTLQGHAVADVIHLLAELVENATAFSSPDTQVLLRSQMVQAGLAVEVEDRGLGMPLEDQQRANALLAGRGHIDVRKLLADGRIGLYVVSKLARRHSIPVKLQTNIYGGVQAVVVLPHALLGEESVPVPQLAAVGMPQPIPAAAAPSAPPVAPAQHRPAEQAWPAAQPVADPRAAARPMPVERPSPTTPLIPHQHSRATEPAAPRDASHALGNDSPDGRPQLPKRRAQEHLAAELRSAPSTDTAGDQEVEPSRGGAFADFRRGTGLADGAPGQSSGNSSRY